MATIERITRCTNCKWKQRSVAEYTKPQSKLQEIAHLIAVGGKSSISKCPECGSAVIPNTKQMVS